MSYAQAIAPTRALALYRLFDELRSIGYATLTLFEDSTPGATDALRAWSEAKGLAFADRTISPPGAPTLAMATVQVAGENSARITVQRRVVS